MKPTSNKNNQPVHKLNVSAVRMDSTLAKRKTVKPQFDMGVSDIQAKEAYKRGGTPIE